MKEISYLSFERRLGEGESGSENKGSTAVNSKLESNRRKQPICLGCTYEGRSVFCFLGRWSRRDRASALSLVSLSRQNPDSDGEKEKVAEEGFCHLKGGNCDGRKIGSVPIFHKKILD